MNPEPTITRCSGRFGQSHDVFVGVVLHTTRRDLVRDDRTRTGCDDHLVSGDRLAGSGVDRLVAGERGVAAVDGGVGTVFAAVPLTTCRNGIDAAEDALDDVGPTNAVERGVDAVLLGSGDGSCHLGGVDEHLGRDTPDIEARSAEGALFEDCDLLAVEPLVGQRVSGSAADDCKVVVRHCAISCVLLAVLAELSAAGVRWPSSHSNHRSSSEKAVAKGFSVERNTS